MNKLELGILLISLIGATLWTFPEIYTVLAVWGVWGLYLYKPEAMRRVAHIPFIVACCAVAYFDGPYFVIPVLIRVATMFYGEFKVGMKAVTRDMKRIRNLK